MTYSKERDQAAGLTDKTLAFTAAMYTITAMILSGALDRHRKLKFAFGRERRGLGGRGARGEEKMLSSIAPDESPGIAYRVGCRNPARDSLSTCA